MPKSKTRRKAKANRRPTGACAPRNLRPITPTYNPRPVYAQQSRIWTVPTAIGLPANSINTLALNDSGDLWEFPVSPSPIKRPYNHETHDFYEAHQIRVAIAAGMLGEVLEAVSDHTRAVLVECSPATNRAEETFAELFSHGDIELTSPKATLVEWLDEMYLGTWSDPSWAVGVFLRDIKGTHTISDEVRQTAYERLYAYLPVRELNLPDGRTIVCLEKPVSDHERFLINQFMLFHHIPQVFAF